MMSNWNGSNFQVGKAVRHSSIPSLAPLTDCTGGLTTNSGYENYEDDRSNIEVLGGFIGDGKLAWRASGPTLEILDPKTCVRKAAWTFGAVIRNPSCISCVCGIGPGKLTHIAVGIDLGADRNPRGMVAVLSLTTSKVVRVLPLQSKVTSLCMITGGEVAVDPSTLHCDLRHFPYLLAVGAQYGNLHVLDLALDIAEVKSDEISPGSIMSFSLPDSTIDIKRREALKQRYHPAFCLSEGMVNNGKFSLLSPDNTVVFETRAHDVYPSAIAYLPQLAALVVGYNFGAFQVINLSTLNIDCTSPYEENNPPVIFFTYQEPENDPRNFVYVWVCRSWNLSEDEHRAEKQEARPVGTLYAMTYDKKEWIEGHGMWYQRLSYMSPRFEFDIFNCMKDEVVGYSRMFAATTVSGTLSSMLQSAVSSALGTIDDDFGGMPEFSLCIFGWLAEVLHEGNLVRRHYVSVFDINQWYQAQMPQNIYIAESPCPYMCFHELDRVPFGAMETILSAAPVSSSWTRHNNIEGSDDNIWYPSALSYEMHLLTSESVVQYECNSIQREALLQLHKEGPAAIVDPHPSYLMCLQAGLIPLENTNGSFASSMVKEREALLNIALDQQLVSLLIRCVSEFCEGKFSHLGCSPSTLLDWASSKLHTIKISNDKLCAPLFDYSSNMIGEKTISSLHQNVAFLSTLYTVISSIRDATDNITSKGVSELESRVKVVDLLRVHLDAVLWFYHCGLLPQCTMADVLDENSVPFPDDLLKDIYDNRRKEIKSLSSIMTGEDLLMIDGILEEAGPAIGDLWMQEGGSKLYPPPSFQSVLSIYLLPSIPISTKHRIIQYLFLDLALLLSDGYGGVVEELVKFPSSFSLSPSLIKLTQAFWLLDHKDFESASTVLLDPLVNKNDITPWQHKRIIKAFLYQKQHHAALLYADIRKPPRLCPEDIKLQLTLLLANGLIREAFHFQQSCKVRLNADDLLKHFFVGCEQLGKLESLVSLPMTFSEEEEFVKYLKNSKYASAIDLLVVYYLQRSRYDEAMKIQDSRTPAQPSLVKGKTGASSALVHGYFAHLPRSLQVKTTTKAPVKKIIYKKPTPLSAHIRQTKSSPKQRDLYNTPMKSNFAAAMTPFRSKAERRTLYCNVNNIQDSNDTQQSFIRDGSRIVFPSAALTDRTCSPKSTSMMSANNSTIFDQNVTIMMDTLLMKSKTTDTSICKKKDTNSQLSKDLMSLLRTPPVLKKRPKATRKSTIDLSYIETPQSILKVKKMIGSATPSVCSEVSVVDHTTTSCKTMDISDVCDSAAPSVIETSSITPKQLRFHLPSRERLDSTSPVAELNGTKTPSPTPPSTANTSIDAIPHLPEADKEINDVTNELETKQQSTLPDFMDELMQTSPVSIYTRKTSIDKPNRTDKSPIKSSLEPEVSKTPEKENSMNVSDNENDSFYSVADNSMQSITDKDKSDRSISEENSTILFSEKPDILISKKQTDEDIQVKSTDECNVAEEESILIPEFEATINPGDDTLGLHVEKSIETQVSFYQKEESTEADDVASNKPNIDTEVIKPLELSSCDVTVNLDETHAAEDKNITEIAPKMTTTAPKEVTTVSSETDQADIQETETFELVLSESEEETELEEEIIQTKVHKSKSNKPKELLKEVEPNTGKEEEVVPMLDLEDIDNDVDADISNNSECSKEVEESSKENESENESESKNITQRDSTKIELTGNTSNNELINKQILNKLETNEVVNSQESNEVSCSQESENISSQETNEIISSQESSQISSQSSDNISSKQSDNGISSHSDNIITSQESDQISSPDSDNVTSSQESVNIISSQSSDNIINSEEPINNLNIENTKTTEKSILEMTDNKLPATPNKLTSIKKDKVEENVDSPVRRSRRLSHRIETPIAIETTPSRTKKLIKESDTSIQVTPIKEKNILTETKEVKETIILSATKKVQEKIILSESKVIKEKTVLTKAKEAEQEEQIPETSTPVILSTPSRGRRRKSSTFEPTEEAILTPSRRITRRMAADSPAGTPIKIDVDANKLSAKAKSLDESIMETQEEEIPECSPPKKSKTEDMDKSTTETPKAYKDTPRSTRKSKKVLEGSPAVKSIVTPSRRSRRSSGGIGDLGTIKEDPKEPEIIPEEIKTPVQPTKKPPTPKSQRRKSARLSIIPPENLEPIAEISEEITPHTSFKEDQTTDIVKDIPEDTDKNIPDPEAEETFRILKYSPKKTDVIKSSVKEPVSEVTPRRSTRARRLSDASSVVSNLSPDRLKDVKETDNSPNTRLSILPITRKRSSRSSASSNTIDDTKPVYRKSRASMKVIENEEILEPATETKKRRGRQRSVRIRSTNDSTVVLDRSLSPTPSTDSYIQDQDDELEDNDRLNDAEETTDTNQTRLSILSIRNRRSSRPSSVSDTKPIIWKSRASMKILENEEILEPATETKKRRGRQRSVRTRSTNDSTVVIDRSLSPTPSTDSYIQDEDIELDTDVITDDEPVADRSRLSLNPIKKRKSSHSSATEVSSRRSETVIMPTLRKIKIFEDDNQLSPLKSETKKRQTKKKTDTETESNRTVFTFATPEPVTRRSGLPSAFKLLTTDGKTKDPQDFVFSPPSVEGKYSSRLRKDSKNEEDL